MERIPKPISAAQARDLIISGNAPANLNVRDSDKATLGTRLDLSNQPDLKVLPEGLTVWGDINLSGCTGLQALPRSLVAKYGLNLTSCTALQELPVDLEARHLDLTGCTALQSIPEGIARDSLVLVRCSALVSLPRTLRLKSYLKIVQCEHLETLPDELFVGGNAFIAHCPGLRTLPQKFTVNATLWLTGCPNITVFPDAKIEQLRIDGETGLRAFPANVSFQGIHLENWNWLTNLPASLNIPGYLSLDHCINLRSLPPISKSFIFI